MHGCTVSWQLGSTSVGQCVARRREPVKDIASRVRAPTCVIVGRHIGSGTACQLPREP